MSKNTQLGNLVNGIFVDSTGRVGVGTTTPANALVVDKGNATASYLQFTAGTTTGVLATDGFEVGIDASGNGIISQQENLPLMIYTNSAERMRITAGGDVGIGTTTIGTSTVLTIGGSETAASAIARGQLVNTTLVASANNDVLVGLDIAPTFNNSGFTGVNLYAIRVAGNIVPSASALYSLGAPSFNFAQAHIRQFLASGTGGFEFYPAFATKSGQWFPTGNLLLQNGGTFTDAGFKLDVVGTARVSGNATFSSNVGIGTSSPDTSLHVLGSTNRPIVISTSNATTVYTTFRYNTSTDVGYIGNGTGVSSTGSSNDFGVQAVNNLIFAAGGGSERMRINSDGTMMLGGTSSSGTAGTGSGRGNLILGGSTSNKITFNNNSTTINGFIYSDSSEFNLTGSGFMVFNAGGSERMRITSAGNVGIGTESPFVGGNPAKLQVKTSTNINLAIQNGTADATGVKLNAFNDAASANIPMELNGSIMILKTGETERARISSGGNVGIGTSSPNSRLQIGTMTSYTGSGYTFAMGNGSVDFLLTINAAQSGSSVTFYSSTDYLFNRSGPSSTGVISAYGFNNISDYRLKYDLEQFEGLSLVSQIKTYKYKMEETHETQYGVLAHEIQEILPHLVVGVKDGDRMQSVDYQKIVPMLIKSVQELKAEIEILKQK